MSESLSSPTFPATSGHFRCPHSTKTSREAAPPPPGRRLPASMRRALLVLSVLGVLGRGAAAAECESYDDGWTSFVLDPTVDFTVFHKVVGSTLHIRLSARTTGWVGFGFGEPTSGHMKGADMMTAFCVGPTAYLDDRYADFAATDDTGYGYAGLTAKKDRNNDWTLISGSEADGTTHIYATRPLVTGDAQDRAVRPGPTRVIWAW